MRMVVSTHAGRRTSNRAAPTKKIPPVVMDSSGQLRISTAQQGIVPPPEMQ
jgi:hypothetical protein